MTRFKLNSKVVRPQIARRSHRDGNDRTLNSRVTFFLSTKQTEACQSKLLSGIPKRTAIDSRQLKSRRVLSKYNGPGQSLQQSLSFQTHFLLCSIRLVIICPLRLRFPIWLPNPRFSSLSNFDIFCLRSFLFGLFFDFSFFLFFFFLVRDRTIFCRLFTCML